MTSRLPEPGQDNGVWGSILNDFLSVEHSTNGSLKRGPDIDQALNDASTALAAAQQDATTSSKGIVQLAGDLSGSAAAPTVAKLNGVAVTGTPSNGQVLTASNGTAANWAAPVAGATGSTGPQGPPGLVWKGVYSNVTTYGTNDAVSYGGASFIATAGTIGVAPGTTSSPNAPWQTLAAAGPTGPAGPGGKSPDPSWVNLSGWTYDPMFIATTQVPTNGVIYLGKMYLAAGTITNLFIDVATGITSPTASANFAGLYSLAGTLIASTADQGANWASTGVISMSLTSPTAVTEGFYYMAVLANGSTIAFQRSSSAGHYNNGAAALTLRTAAYGSGQTALPANLTMASTVATNIALWGGAA